MRIALVVLLAVAPACASGRSAAPRSLVPGVQDALDQVAKLQDACDLDAARPHLERALALQTSGGGSSPGDAATWQSIGEKQRTEGDVAGARASFERAIAITSRDAAQAELLATLLGLRGAMERRLGLLAEAEATHEQAFAITRSTGEAPGTRHQRAIDALWESVRDARGSAAADARIAREGLVRVVRAGRGTETPLPAAGAPAPCTRPRSASGVTPGASAVVSRIAPDVRRCYNALLAAQPELQGKLTLLAPIDAAGDPVRAVAYVPGPLAGLAECSAGHLAAAKFAPPTGGGANLVVPLSFFSR